MKTAGIALLVAAVASPALGARVVFNETFTGATRSAGTGADVYLISGTYNWYVYSPANATVDVTGSGGSPADAVGFVDTSTSQAGRMEMNFSNFAPMDTTQPADSTITFSADIRVDAFQTGSPSSSFRFALKDSGRANPFFTVGFTRDLNTDVSGWKNHLFLFAGDTASSNNYFTPGQADAIGWNGSTWAPGFDFGVYDDTNSGANNDTFDQFYRLEVTFHPFDGAQQAIDVRATNLDTLQSATLTRTVTTPYAFSSIATDGLAFTGGGSARGTMYVDNVLVSVVPEPAALGLLIPLALGLRRRRAR